MPPSINQSKDCDTVKVSHDLQRQLLEILSLFRVMNDYYNKKNNIQKQIKPLILKKFKDGLKTLEEEKNWLHSISISLNILNEDLLSRKDTFKFPDSILLFEAWMNLGFKALYPRLVILFKFPGILKGEKFRNVFQFIFSTSRGFGFPIYFGPEFYDYKPKYAKILNLFFKWCYTVCHKANQAIVLGNKRLKSNRHHPGEFESVIVSEYTNNTFKGINTLLHGYFTKTPKYLGEFDSIEEALKKVMFFYSIGDHAMSVGPDIQQVSLDVPLISHDFIVKNYEIDFYSYIKKLIAVNKLLNKKILYYNEKKTDFINKLKKIEKIKYYIDKYKKFPFSIPKASKYFSEIKKINNFITIIEKVRELLWTTPLYTHTIHDPTKKEKLFLIPGKTSNIDDLEQESTNSILLKRVKSFELTYGIVFEDNDVIEALKGLRDHMAKMWLFFKERQFKYAIKKLNELASLSLHDPNYNKKVKEYVEKLLPIFSIYEIFNRSLFESVYPESVPQTKRLGAYIATFLASKYNPIGVNLMHLFNKLAFYNWSYYIVKKKLNREQFFDLMIKLPIWKHIPDEIKIKLLSRDSQKS